MRYRIVERDGRYYPKSGGWLFWNPLLDFMNNPAEFGTEVGARLFIEYSHCNWLNATAGRRIKWGRTQTPKVG